MLEKGNSFQVLNECVKNKSRIQLISQHLKIPFGGCRFQMNKNLLIDKIFVPKEHLLVY